MTVLRLIFGGFVFLEAGGALVFAVAYLSGTAWHQSPVGRHLAVYSVVLAVLFPVTLASIVWRGHYFLYGGEIIVHMALTVMLWHRVFLVLRDREGPPAGGGPADDAR